MRKILWQQVLTSFQQLLITWRALFGRESFDITFGKFYENGHF